MSLKRQTVSNPRGRLAEVRQIFTFYVEDMMFGLDVANVLMLSQIISDVQRLPVEELGLCGVVRFQGYVVPVLDFAHRLGISSGSDMKNALLAELMAREQDHVEWLNSLERSIKGEESFNKAVNPDECEFGRWYNQFETRDETLHAMLKAFDEPHRKIHGLAETLLHLASEDKVEEALQILNHQRITTLSKLRGLFARAREQVKSAVRPILLFVTDDGMIPRYALLIDEINDVVNYTDADFYPASQGSMAQFRSIAQVLNGIFTKADQPDCLFFNIDLLATSTLDKVDEFVNKGL